MTTKLDRSVDENDERRRVHALLLRPREQRTAAPPMPDSPWRSTTHQELRKEDDRDYSSVVHLRLVCLWIAAFFFAVGLSPLAYYHFFAVGDDRTAATWASEAVCSLIVRESAANRSENALYLGMNGALRTTTHDTVLSSGAAVYEDRRGVIADSVRCWLLTTTTTTTNNGDTVVARALSLNAPSPCNARCDIRQAIGLTIVAFSITIVVLFLQISAEIGNLSATVRMIRKQVIRRNALLRLFSIVAADASEHDISDALLHLML
jgi:hypothetical protein